MKKSEGRKLLILGVILVVIDQVIKVLVKTNMGLGEHFDVIGNWFKILFVENEGMAFGWAFGGKVGKLLLSIFRICLCGALIWWISSLCRKNGAARAEGKAAPIPAGVLVGLTLITAGAFGNIIDSLFYGVIWGYAPFLFGKVVDMFYFPLWTWPDWLPLLGGHLFFEPVFNFADSCVTVGAFYLILFQWKFFAKGDD
jgi:signal peptidase II